MSCDGAGRVSGEMWMLTWEVSRDWPKFHVQQGKGYDGYRKQPLLAPRPVFNLLHHTMFIDKFFPKHCTEILPFGNQDVFAQRSEGMAERRRFCHNVEKSQAEELPGWSTPQVARREAVGGAFPEVATLKSPQVYWADGECISHEAQRKSSGPISHF